MPSLSNACYVFDIDDTLYLERDYVESGFRTVGQWVENEWGLPGFFEKAMAAFTRGVRGTTFNVVLEEMGIAEAEAPIEQMAEIYRRHEPTIALLADAEECLWRLAERFAMAVVTDGPLASQQAKSEALGLDRWLRPIVFTEDLGEGFGKPHPRAFEIVQHAMGAMPEVCVYVADNPAKDFAGPKQLGWRTVRLRRQGGLHFDAENGLDVDIELPDLIDFESRIR